MLAYCHKVKEKTSFALRLPAKTVLLHLLKNFMPSLVVPFGVARCHPKDNFVKKIGREIASKKLIDQTFILMSIEYRNGKMVFHFTDYIHTLGFSIVEKSDKVRLEYIMEDCMFLPPLKEID